MRHHSIRYFAMFAALAFAGQALAQEAVRVKPPQNKVLASENGRYVFGQISEFRRDQFLLDTKTGRVWTTVVTKGEEDKDGVIVLQPVLFMGLDGKPSLDPR